MLLLFCTRLVNISLKKISKGNPVFIQVPVFYVLFAFIKNFSNGNVFYIYFAIFADLQFLQFYNVQNSLSRYIMRRS